MEGDLRLNFEKERGFYFTLDGVEVSQEEIPILLDAVLMAGVNDG